MAKLFVVSIGYTEYACTMQQGVTLLAALEPLRMVKKDDWKGPYIFQSDSTPIVDTMSLQDCHEPEPPEPGAERLAITHQPLAIGIDDEVTF